MKLFGRCETPLCGRRGLFIRKRVYPGFGVSGTIISKTRTCSACARRVAGLIRRIAEEQAGKSMA